MKQIIVMIAMLILGLGIGGLVMGFSGEAEDVRDIGVSGIAAFTTEATSNL